MTSKQKRELKVDLTFGYNNFMKQLYAKWSDKGVDQDELRFTVAKMLATHAMDKIMEKHKRQSKKVAKANKLISLLEQNLAKQAQAQRVEQEVQLSFGTGGN